MKPLALIERLRQARNERLGREAAALAAAREIRQWTDGPKATPQRVARLAKTILLAEDEKCRATQAKPPAPTRTALRE